MKIFSYKFIIKSDSVPALRAGAGPLFIMRGEGFVVSVLRGTGVFPVLYLSVVTKMAPIGARRLRWECISVCPQDRQ